MAREVIPPPPPPPPPSRARPDSRVSPHIEQLLSAPADYLKEIPPPSTPSPTHPVNYFFYGTLAQPEVLKRILELPQEPAYRPAHIIGYSLSSWGQYRTLINGEPGEQVHGTVFKVASEEDDAKLTYYETKAYKTAWCRLHYDDGKQPDEAYGTTFMYAGDAAALKAGRFDKVLWERTMGMSLPPLRTNATRPADCPPLS